MKKILLTIFLLIMIILFSSCWDMREINELGLVTAVAVDKGEGQNKYSLTVQIANPTTDNSSKDKSAAKETVWVGTAEGESLFDATRKLVTISSRRIMWAHNNVVIIGESLAREGIIPVVDYFTHNPELRMKADVVVSKGDAKDYIAAKTGMDSPSGMSFILLEGYRKIEAVSVGSHMLNVSSALKNEYDNPLISEIFLKKAIMQAGDGDNKSKDSETVDMAGAAVFKRDKMLGWLSPEETLGVSWILNGTNNKVVTVTDPDYGNKSIAVETKSMKVKIKSVVVNKIPKISIHITGKGDIVEEDGSTIKSMIEVKQNAAIWVNKKIEDEIKRSLETVQKKYMVDVLGFAAIVHAQNDGEWKNGLKDRWQEIFPEIPVTVSAEINIKSSTLNQEPMKVY